MRHKIAGRRLSRTSAHRLAMRRNLVSSLFEHETVSTTMEKAKEVKAFAEKLITLSRKGTLSARRRAITVLGDRDIVSHEDGKEVKKSTVIGKLFSEIGPQYLDRPGGYTRIVRLSLKRLGDNGQLVLLQLVGKEESDGKKVKALSAKKRDKKQADQIEHSGTSEEASEAISIDDDQEVTKEGAESEGAEQEAIQQAEEADETKDEASDSEK